MWDYFVQPALNKFIACQNFRLQKSPNLLEQERILSENQKFTFISKFQNPEGIFVESLDGWVRFFPKWRDLTISRFQIQKVTVFLNYQPGNHILLVINSPISVLMTFWKTFTDSRLILIELWRENNERTHVHLRTDPQLHLNPDQINTILEEFFHNFEIIYSRGVLVQ